MNVSDLVKGLRALDANALLKLPEKEEQTNIQIDGAPHTVITWHDEIEPGQHGIVVAAYREAIAGLVTRIWAQGFIVAADGTKRDLTDSELSPFQ